MRIVEWIATRLKASLPGDQHALNGHRAVNAGDYGTAAAEFEEALRLGVRKYPLAQVYTMLGTSYDELKRYDHAITAHERSVEIDPRFHEAWNNLGIAHFNAGHIDQAVACTEKALELKPQYAFGYGSLGGIEIHRNVPAKAIEYLKQAIVLNPSMAIAHSNLALAYGMTGRFEEAEAALRQAVALGYKNWKEIKTRLENLHELNSKVDENVTGKRQIGFKHEEN